MPELLLKRNLAEYVGTMTLVLSRIADPATADATHVDLFYKFESDADSEPQFAGRVAAGHTLLLPLEIKAGETVRLYQNPVSGTGNRGFSNYAEMTQTTFASPQPPTLAELTFDSGTDDVTGTIAENGGTGDIHVLRQLGTDDYVEVDSVASGTTSFTDGPSVDGTYNYKLMQDGIDGDSNIRTVEVDVGVPGTGTAPTDLTAGYDDIDTASLAWTNHGGTGSNIVERKRNVTGIYSVVATLSSSANSHDDIVIRDPFNRTYYYRVRNESTDGYSNEADIFVPAE